ncbi:YceI family protein [Tenacibaculum amylolyticum]|uniref:YceI family protein n=1 Tax=Tenacibaculum amylolyticum TaxID=104269 RepID=UPI003894FA67
MRKIIMLFVSIICLSTQCKAQEKIVVNIEKSTIKWIGEYTFYFGGHDGFISFKEGYFLKTNDMITGGEFIIDMNSITNTDVEDTKANKGLVDHLKASDFFDVERYPTAKLKITFIEYFENNHVKINADLTIKGITKPIHFNAEFNYKERKMFARFKIDRRDWNVSYKSKLKNNAISDAIGFEVTIKL